MIITLLMAQLDFFKTQFWPLTFTLSITIIYFPFHWLGAETQRGDVLVLYKNEGIHMRCRFFLSGLILLSLCKHHAAFPEPANLWPTTPEESLLGFLQ